MKSHESKDEFRHLSNQEYNVLLGMTYEKAKRLYKELVESGIDHKHAAKLIKDVFKIELDSKKE